MLKARHEPCLFTVSGLCLDTMMQCPQCAYGIAPQGDQSLPPWCPRCGRDLKPKGSALPCADAEMEPGLRCRHCAHKISLQSDQGLPPWCPRCGRDLKPETSALPLTEMGQGAGRHPRLPGTARPIEAAQVPAQPWDERSCFSCGTPVDLTAGPDAAVVYCPECGQCLKAPRPWTPPFAGWVAGSMPAGLPGKTKLHGSTSVFLGLCAVAGGCLIAHFEFFMGTAFALFGGAMLAEGMGRLRVEARKKLARRPTPTLELPSEISLRLEKMGGLLGVYETTTRWLDSLAIVFLGLALGFSSLFAVDWLAGGIISAKVLLVALFSPALAIYLGYRAVRNLCDRHCVLVFAEGLVHIRGARMDIYPWDRVVGISYEELGDAIDENAVEIRLKFGHPSLRFTCLHFHNLHWFLENVQQGF